MSPRLLSTALVTVLVAAAPASAQDVTPLPEVGIGEAAAAAGGVIRDGDTRFGTIEVERIGEKITVTAHFSKRPPGKRASLCVTVGGDRQCVRKASRRGLELTMERTASFLAGLRATARSGAAAGAVSL